MTPRLRRWVESGALRAHRSSRREIADLATYFDSCRVLRNASDYDRTGVVSESDVEELLREVVAFRERVLSWPTEAHPRLL